MSAGAGLVLCALACTVRADFLPGSYAYGVRRGSEHIDTTYTVKHIQKGLTLLPDKLDLCTCKFKDGNDVDVVDNERRGSGE